MLRFGVSISSSVLSGMSFAVTDLVPGHLHRKGSLSPSILARSHSLNAVSFACACGLRCRPCVAGLYPVTVIASQHKTRHSGKTGINGNTENRLKGMNMKRLYSGFRQANVIRKTRPLTNDELFRHVPSVFSEEKHASRSERYTYIPTINLLDRLREEGFHPFYACQTKVRDDDKRGHTRHMLRLRRDGFGQNDEVPEIILLNSHDGSSSYQMIPGIFRFVCNNGLVCGDTFGEVRVPHKGDVVGRVIDGAYEVLSFFEKVTDSRDEMKGVFLDKDEQHVFAEAALGYKYFGEHQPITAEQVLSPRRWQDKKDDLWTTFQRVQENIIKGEIPGISANGKRNRTRAVNSITGDVKLNNALWKMAETMKNLKS